MKLHKKWWFWVGVILTVGSAFTPFIIDYLTIKFPYFLSFEKADLLTFWGSFLAFMGTVALGSLALWQNKKSNDINGRLSKIEDEKFKLDMQPFVIINDWKTQFKDAWDVVLTPKKLYFNIGSEELKTANFLCLTIFLTNTSNSYSMVSYSKANVYNGDSSIGTWSNVSSNLQNTKLYLKPSETGEIVFYASEDTMKSWLGNMVRLELTLENRFSERYKETVDIFINVLNKNNDNSWYTYLHIQNYTIDKFIKNKDGKIILESEDN